MTDIEHTQTAIARCEAKREAARDAGRRRYCEVCLIGWRRWLQKLEAGAG